MQDTKDRAQGSLALAAVMARYADALAQYGHLPTLDCVTVRVSQVRPAGTATAGVASRGRIAWREIAEWAVALDGTLVLDMSFSGYLNSVIEVAGLPLELSQYVGQRDAYELGALLQIPVAPGGVVQLDPAALIAALTNPAVA